MGTSLKLLALATMVALQGSWATGQAKDTATATVKLSQLPDQDEGKPTKIEIKDGKLIIIDQNGNHQEIDVMGANVLSVTQSSSEENIDGKIQNKSHGKAIIVGPDGKKTEIEFDGPIALPGMTELKGIPAPGRIRARAGNAPMEFEWKSEALPPGLNFVQGDVSKFFIGVMAVPVEETLRVHLGLDENAGLVVKSVTPDSPAAKAGLQEHDILLFADESQLTDIQSLGKVVDQAGSDSKGMTLTLLRAGKEIRVELSPAERPKADLNLLAGDLMMPGLELGEIPGGKRILRLYDLERLGPGLLFGADGEGQPEAMQQMQEVMKRAAEEMRNQMELMREQIHQSQRQLQESSDMMKRQMEELNILKKKAPQGDGKTDSGK